MPAVRQAATALIYGIISLVLVIGSLALAQAQGGPTSISAPTFTPLPGSTATPRPSPVATSASTGSATAAFTETPAPPTNLPTRATSTATKAAAPTVTASSRSTCGPPYGWTKAYVVQSGDTLFRIAILHGTSVDAVQNANCRSSTVIFVGERLWVPSVRPAATELTVIPTFPTPTEQVSGAQTAAPDATQVTPDP